MLSEQVVKSDESSLSQIHLFDAGSSKPNHSYLEAGGFMISDVLLGLQVGGKDASTWKYS